MLYEQNSIFSSINPDITTTCFCPSHRRRIKTMISPWYKVVTPRPEVREGRSFSPDEFAIALEQVVTGTAPLDYRDPLQFFSRTCFTRALKDHVGMVIRRLAGETQNTSPVLTLVTQFGGGKTHTLTALYHLANLGIRATSLPGVSNLLNEAGIHQPSDAKIGVFVGNAWDPTKGRETPWIDLARQLAGNRGVDVLGTEAITTPPGTESIARVFAAAESPVLLLFDEVLNFVNRYRDRAESFHAFIQNLTVAITGTTNAVAVISLPRSQVEMTDWDQEWQDRITKVVRRVSRDLIANDEAEVGDVVRRRLFEDLGNERIRKQVSKKYADWCFERISRLPSEWTTADSGMSEAKARKDLQSRFEACYPFHPSTLSVFRRKWSALTQFQQTRGTLAMLAQWVSWAAKDQFQKARTEPLITLGSAPLDVPEFRAVVLGQLGEQRLDAAMDADIVGSTSHAHALDSDTKGGLCEIHRRVGTAIFFESSGGQVDKTAYLPELRFALGELEVETTTIDNTAAALESSGFFIRKVGIDGFRIHHQATLKKVVSDRRSALDEKEHVVPAIRKLVKEVFTRGATLPIELFPKDGADIQDTRRLTIVVVDPEMETGVDEQITDRVARWTREKGSSPRLYPASLVWCVKKSGRGLYDRVGLWLAWQRVFREVEEGLHGTEFGQADKTELRNKVRGSQEAAKDEVWSSYRFVILADRVDSGIKIKTIDIGSGHSSANETLCSRVITALRTEALLNESVSSAYLERKWPPVFKDAGSWPLTSLRQSFLDGSLTRLIDPDTTLRQQIVKFVGSGEFGLASGATTDGRYNRIWYAEPLDAEDVSFESNVFLLTKTRSEYLRRNIKNKTQPKPDTTDKEPQLKPESEIGNKSESKKHHTITPPVKFRISGRIPPESWNLLGTKIVSKLRSGDGLTADFEFNVKVAETRAASLEDELRQILNRMNLTDSITVERS